MGTAEKKSPEREFSGRARAAAPRSGALSCCLRMTNDSIPNLTAFDEAALDQAFAALRASGRRSRRCARRLAEAVEAFRLQWLGRKQGRLNEVSGRWLKSAPPEAKKAIGQRFNALKAEVERLLEQAAGAGPDDAALKAEAIDITLPGTRAAYRRRTSHYAHAERDRERLCGAGLLGGRGAGGRNRLLQLREHELSARPSGARHAGHAGGRQPGAPAAARPAAAAHAYLARCRCGPWSSSRRRCAS